MASGVTCAPNVKDEFALMKTRGTYKIMMFKLSDDNKEIVIDEGKCLKGVKEDKASKEDRDAKQVHENDLAIWEAMVEGLVCGEPRYIVFDVNCISKAGRAVKKLVFISWCADDCLIKKKMIHAASEEYLKKALDGIAGTVIQAHDRDDLEYKEALKIAITRD